MSTAKDELKVAVRPGQDVNAKGLSTVAGVIFEHPEPVRLPHALTAVFYQLSGDTPAQAPAPAHAHARGNPMPESHR